jgi:hypothetical protein
MEHGGVKMGQSDCVSSTEEYQKEYHVTRLNTAHKAELAKSGLSSKTIVESGIYTAHKGQIRELGISTRSNGMVIPYLNVEGEIYARVKLDSPGKGKTYRYRSPQGRGNRLYIPPMLTPQVLTDSSQSLWITEGEKKALKGCQEGLNCLSIPGVWCWRTKCGRKKSVPLPDFDHIAWAGRIVSIVFDSDVTRNSNVAQAERELAGELGRRGADVYLVRIPEGEQGQKVGLDEYLIAHSVEEFRALPSIRISSERLDVALRENR